MAHFILKNHKSRLLLIMVVIVMSCGYALRSDAQYSRGMSDLEMSSLLSKKLQKSGFEADKMIRFFDPVSIRAFYEARDYRPLWNDTEDIRDILGIFEASWTHGLNPNEYHVTQIKQFLKEGRRDGSGLELAVTDGVMRYGHDLGGMRFDPSLIKQKAEYWRMPVDGLTLMKTVTASHDYVQAIKDFAPDNTLYVALQKELVRLLQEESGYDHVLPMGFGGSNHFIPGSKSKDVVSLRIRLGVQYKPEYGAENYYDDNTASAMMAFQRAHGLEPDGIIGPQSLAVLNRSNRDRMEQIVANLERARWLPQEKPDRYLLVNIPQQLVWAVDKGKTVFEMKVVVGMPWRRTKEFTTEVKGVRFNPNWTVPIGIKMADFLPKLKENPDYLTEKNIEIIKGYGKEAVTLDPHAIDWNTVGWKEMGAMRFVQNPGDDNALGAVRILMPNIYNIYMHDTNHPEFFERGQRTYSSGCIRLHEPEKMANFVLGGNGDWSPRDMDGIIATGKTTEVMTSKPFPVYIIYQTVWLDGKGQIVYGSDVYKRDRELIDVLAAMHGYYLPVFGNADIVSVDGEHQTALAYNN
ncbi:MAG: murein L,D-transpeptidase [Alphaproteobacteria bacterium CG_4_9_14_3_um_filter_47_13]|nr:MAG: murein L,D-transpeptidase [Alphaproteobacteria bacterium CG_4_9_14_3_um_filter_47_13]